jgi:acetyl-CoA C-acetyltransferase
MPDAVIISAERTPIGTFRKGTLAATTAFDLGRHIVAASVERSGLSVDDIDDVLLGEVLYGGGDLARHSALSAGLTRVPGVSLNRQCASSLAAVTSAAGSIRAGMDRAVIAGGVESRSTAPVSSFRDPATGVWQEQWLSPSHPPTPEAPADDMTITVGWNTAVRAGLTRQELDAWAARSHQRAVAAIDAGRFADEIVPIAVTLPDGSQTVFAVDEHPRRDTTAERLAALKPLHPEIDGFSITAGNSSGINDAAAAVTLASSELVAERGLTPLAVVRAWGAVGVDPVETGLAPIAAIRLAVRRAGLEVGDVDLWEINEAFASVSVAATRALDLDDDTVNVTGSGCSLGHPIAASGARMITSLVYELRRRGGGVGVAAMCAGGGQGSAVVIEVPA